MALGSINVPPGGGGGWEESLLLKHVTNGYPLGYVIVAMKTFGTDIFAVLRTRHEYSSELDRRGERKFTLRFILKI